MALRLVHLLLFLLLLGCGTCLIELFETHSPGQSSPSKGLFGKKICLAFIGAGIVATVPVFVALAADAPSSSIPLSVFLSAPIIHLFLPLLLFLFRLVVELNPLRDGSRGQKEAHARQSGS